MIQAPQTQYIPAQQQMQMAAPVAYAAPVAQNVQPQTPGVIYNYPTASAYSYAPSQAYGMGKSQFNGVNIEIINPQGQAGVPGMQTCPMPAQFMPVQQPVYIPQYQMQQQMVYPQPMQQPVAPAPVIVEQPAGQMSQVQQQGPQVQQQQVPQAAAPVIEPAAPVDPSVSPESFAGRLAASDLDEQRAAIESIAQMVKGSEPTGNVLLDTQIFDSLVNIIDKDTSSLEGPSPEVIELRQKPADQLTDAEKQKAATPSPLEKAELNKQYALYTISYMQERLNNELSQRNGSALELKDLPAIEKVVDTVKSNPNPMLRVAGLSALAHVARPEYKSDLTTIFELAKADEDSKVQEIAASLIENLK